MKVLHLLSDWKWTGPAEPVVRLCRGLRERGVEVEFFCKAPPEGRRGRLLENAADLHPATCLRLKKSPNLLANLRDVRALARHLDEAQVDVVHVHTTHDHMIGPRAARKSHRKPAVVRTNHTGVPLPGGYWTRRMITGGSCRRRGFPADPPARLPVGQAGRAGRRGVTASWTDGMVELSQRAREADARAFRFPAEHVITVEGSVDLDRFRPDGVGEDMRPELGLRPDDIVVGVVARIQKRRRFDVFLKGMKLASEKCERLRGLIVGRGTHRGPVAVKPARKMGVADRIVFAGYRTDDYVSVLGAMDFMVYLVPGSDGSCRAAREAMAIGKPVIAARRGLLPELVEDGLCGLVIDDTPRNLAEAILRLAEDAELRRRLGSAAARKAAEKFRIETQVEAVLALYRALTGLG